MRARYIAGWSWLELLLVMLIIAILLLIAMPTLQLHRLKSHRADMQAELLRLAVQIQQHLLLQPSTAAGLSAQPTKAISEQRVFTLASLGLTSVYPNHDEVWYDLSLQGTAVAWQLIARPRIESQQVLNDILILDHQGQLCITASQQVNCEIKQ